jgi:hypothetical protein
VRKISGVPGKFRTAYRDSHIAQQGALGNHQSHIAQQGQSEITNRTSPNKGNRKSAIAVAPSTAIKKIRNQKSPIETRPLLCTCTV